MKSFRFFSFGVCAGTAVVSLALLANARAANTNTAASAKGGTNSLATNSAPAELPVPRSMFDLAAKPTKDPFFPLSLRQPIPSATNTLSLTAASFVLKGLSGSASQRLALINNRTVAPGENAEITTLSGKIKIRCLEVRESSVLIRAGAQSEPIEIFLRKAAQ